MSEAILPQIPDPKWEEEQKKLKSKLILNETMQLSLNGKRISSNSESSNYQATSLFDMVEIKFIGGVDISYIKENDNEACTAFVVISYPEMKVVHMDVSMVRLNAPYIPGYLAFREVNFFVDKIESLRKENSDIFPQLIMVDGNGILHPKGFGLASHLGVLVNLPTIGCAKNLHFVQGLEKNQEHKTKIETLLLKSGDTFPLVSDKNQTIGMALRSSDTATNPIYVSIGHLISLSTAVSVVHAVCKHRVPEPIRIADIESRKYLRENGFNIKN